MFARLFKTKSEIKPKIIYENPVYVDNKQPENTVIDDNEPEWYTDEPNPDNQGAQQAC